MEDQSTEHQQEELLKALLQQRQYTKFRQTAADMNTADIAAVMSDMEDEELLKSFRLLPKHLAADVFSDLELKDQQYIISSLSDTEASTIIDNLQADDATDLLEEMPAEVVKQILRNASPETRADINHLLRYPEDSAGSIMTVEFVDLQEEMTVQEAIARVREIGMDSETANTCYVVDAQRILKGSVTLRTLVLSDPQALVEDIMKENAVRISTLSDQEEAAQMFQKYDLTIMPVVDKDDRMVGIITIDDVVDIIQQEATEDIEKMAAILPTADKAYFSVGIGETFRKRIPWLLLLMLSAAFTGAIILHYLDELRDYNYLVLVAYIPMLMDTGGNAGSQASTTIIRALSLGEVEFSDTARALWKEFRVSLLCGITLSVCNFVRMMIFDHVGFMVCLVICVTMIVVVIAAKLIGALLPILAKRIGIDPAAMASPLITTIMDTASLWLYFAIATALLKI